MIDRSMFNIEGHESIPPIQIKPWWIEWQEVMIEDCQDTIQFLQQEITVSVMVIELCGLVSKAGQTAVCQKRLHETELTEARERLQRYRSYFNGSD